MMARGISEKSLTTSETHPLRGKITVQLRGIDFDSTYGMTLKFEMAKTDLTHEEAHKFLGRTFRLVDEEQ